MRSLATAVTCLALASCATVQPSADGNRFFADDLFTPPSVLVDARQVFAASEAMKLYVATELGEPAGTKSRQRALLEALRDKARLRLEYDATYTRNAAEAFDARTGNCLSLVIMTAALAKELGVSLQYQKVFVDETWSRQGDIDLSIGHVNLTLGTRRSKLGTHFDGGEPLTVDFLPPPDLKTVNWAVIPERTVVAMYMNNRAAESLAAGWTDDAYWFAREAIAVDPDFVTAYNTLGIVYTRRGHFGHAARTLAHALGREPRNTHVMSNLANVYASLGRAAEARELEARVAELDPEPPFVHFDRGLAAMREGNYSAARGLFAKEVARAPYYHEFHFWLALALANLGEAEEARRHLVLALENSTTRRDRDLYAAKLEHIKSARANARRR